jgi:5-methylcytosine-specific restriction endonuclease McrA
VVQGLLFGDDDEARVKERERQTALEKTNAEVAARKGAWETANQMFADGADMLAIRNVFRTDGEQFPPEMAKWAAAHREQLNARFRESYRLMYPECSDYFLYNSARYRAEKLGCKVGRKGPMQKIYRRAMADDLIPCYWCKYLTKRGERHVDHIQPLANGGGHVAGNLCIACIDCNLSKGDDPPEVFRERIAPKRSFNQAMLREYFLRRASA